MDVTPTMHQRASMGEPFLAPRPVNWLKGPLSENPQASYYGARYYDQSAGRLVSEDPIRFGGGNNFYAYVHNRPVVLTDPSGQDDRCPSWIPDWLCKWWKGPSGSQPPKSKPPVQPTPVNICEAGQTALFSEAGPNPYYHGNAGEDDWRKFKSEFIDKCIAAKKAGKGTVTFCTQGAGVLGAFAYCTCCEYCDSKK
jgi:RHS repeat-associated protein